MERLIASEKGHTDFNPAESFMLHVFWETPSPAAAATLLAALKRCAEATNRDTPCVPTYFFRVSRIDADLCAPPLRTVAEHAQLALAKRRLRAGVAEGAVYAEMRRAGLDPSLAELSEEDELPEALKTQPTMVECTELYLDGRAFSEHAGSRDYLSAYGAVMQPSLQHGRPTTLRFGTPPEAVVSGILGPMLNEHPTPVPDSCVLFRVPQSAGGGGASAFVSLDVPAVAAAEVVGKVPKDVFGNCTTLLAYPHPLRANSVRLACAMPAESVHLLSELLSSVNPSAGEIHSAAGEAASKLQEAVAAAGFANVVTVNATSAVGYVLHQRASDLHTCQQL